jgi:hypothetical protein
VGGRFEDVGLGEGDDGYDDEGEGEGDEGGRGRGGRQGVVTKKRGFFSKFEFGGGDGSAGSAGSGSGNGGVEEESGAGTVMSRFLPLGGGRKRAQSGGQGAELGVMGLPAKVQGVEA